MMVLRSIMFAALTATAVALAAPASAQVVVMPPATATSCSIAQLTGATACAGGYTGNLNQGLSVTAPGLQALQSLGYTGTGNAIENLPSLVGTGATGTINFTNALVGTFFVGIHYGGAGDRGGQATSFYRIDGGATGMNLLTFSRGGNANASGLSNASLYANVAAVPEPATWAMMLFGFGMTGFSMRRRRGARTLPQVA
jgi:PEP-CTERM motif